VNNDDTDSNKSGSSRSDPHGGHAQPGMLVFPASNMNFQKGKQLPRGIYLNTHELVDLSNDSDSTQLRRIDRWVWFRLHLCRHIFIIFLYIFFYEIDFSKPRYLGINFFF